MSCGACNEQGRRETKGQRRFRGAPRVGAGRLRGPTVITCREVTEQANDYLENELRFWPRLQFRLHLLACRNCRRYVDQLQRTIDLLSKTTVESLRAEAEEAIVTTLRLRDEDKTVNSSDA